MVRKLNCTVARFTISAFRKLIGTTDSWNWRRLGWTGLKPTSHGIYMKQTRASLTLPAILIWFPFCNWQSSWISLSCSVLDHIFVRSGIGVDCQVGSCRIHSWKFERSTRDTKTLFGTTFKCLFQKYFHSRGFGQRFYLIQFIGISMKVHILFVSNNS